MIVPHICSSIKNAFVAGNAKMSVPETKAAFGIANVLFKQGFISAISRGNMKGIDYSPTTPKNISERRYWLDLKYRDGRPVLSTLDVISKPSRRIFATPGDIILLASGRKGKICKVKPPNAGEIFVIDTHNPQVGIVDLHEAARLQLGGEILCSAN